MRLKIWCDGESWKILGFEVEVNKILGGSKRGLKEQALKRGCSVEQFQLFKIIINYYWIFQLGIIPEPFPDETMDPIPDETNKP
jgi:hypothetical protein